MSAPLLTGAILPVCTPMLTGCTDCKAGRVEWTRVDGVWRGRCGSCSLTTRAASSDARALDKRAEEQARG